MEAGAVTNEPMKHQNTRAHMMMYHQSRNGRAADGVKEIQRSQMSHVCKCGSECLADRAETPAPDVELLASVESPRLCPRFHCKDDEHDHCRNTTNPPVELLAPVERPPVRHRWCCRVDLHDHETHKPAPAAAMVALNEDPRRCRR